MFCKTSGERGMRGSSSFSWRVCTDGTDAVFMLFVVVVEIADFGGNAGGDGGGGGENGFGGIRAWRGSDLRSRRDS